ncbi:MAG: aminoacyl-tRNA hydrolase [Candidatus Eisenbacteria bacterium]|nr:aminoacyl-tRNA hydrolase [Candidatus Eisenbacteria bacterium]
MPLVVGLGNPGARYAHTRHNVGWLVLDRLARKWRADPGETTPGYRSMRAVPGGRSVDLVWPMSFMNASGEALEEWRRRHDFASRDLLVISDDVYLPIGTLRIRTGGSSGGHRGLESIESSLASREYGRLRIGVGHPGEPELREHVLDEFQEDEQATVTETLARAAEAAECWVLEGVTAAMNRFNRRLEQEVEEP